MRVSWGQRLPRGARCSHPVCGLQVWAILARPLTRTHLFPDQRLVILPLPLPLGLLEWGRGCARLGARRLLGLPIGDVAPDLLFEPLGAVVAAQGLVCEEHAGSRERRDQRRERDALPEAERGAVRHGECGWVRRWAAATFFLFGDLHRPLATMTRDVGRQRRLRRRTHAWLLTIEHANRPALGIVNGRPRRGAAPPLSCTGPHRHSHPTLALRSAHHSYMLQSSLRRRVVLAEHVVLLDVRFALPGVREPDIGRVDGREVRDVGGDLASLGLEPGVSARERRMSEPRRGWS